MRNSAATPRIQLDPAGGYLLLDQRLKVGDRLELWTSYGWESGRFAWLGEPHLPFLDQCPPETPFEAGRYDRLIITEGMVCRRLQQMSLEGVNETELKTKA